MVNTFAYLGICHLQNAFGVPTLMVMKLSRKVYLLSPSSVPKVRVTRECAFKGATQGAPSFTFLTIGEGGSEGPPPEGRNSSQEGVQCFSLGPMQPRMQENTDCLGRAKSLSRRCSGGAPL